MKKMIFSAVLALCFIGAEAQETLRLSLQECREMALEASEDLQKADNERLKAEYDKAIAMAANLPNFSATGLGEYMTDMDMMGMTLQMHGMYMAGITLAQPVYVGGKIRAANKLAKIGEEAAEETLRSTRSDVISDADNAYWSYISVLSKIKMLESIKEQMDTLFSQVGTSLEAGMSTRSDLLRVEANRSDIEYQIQKALNGANLCRLSLCNVIGADFDTLIEPTDTVITPTLIEYLEVGTTTTRPELRLLDMQLEAAKYQVRSTRADFLPQLALSLGYVYYGNMKMITGKGTAEEYSMNMEDGIGMAMLSLSVPIFHWGEGRKTVKKAKLDVHNAELDLQKTRRLLNIEEQQALQNLQDGRRLVQVAELSYAQAEESYRIENERYLGGMGTLTDFLDAQGTLMQAESNLIEAQTQMKIYETEYLRVTDRL